MTLKMMGWSLEKLPCVRVSERVEEEDDGLSFREITYFVLFDEVIGVCQPREGRGKCCTRAPK